MEQHRFKRPEPIDAAYRNWRDGTLQKRNAQHAFPNPARNRVKNIAGIEHPCSYCGKMFPTVQMQVEHQTKKCPEAQKQAKYMMKRG